jgi:VRR-NUC domain
MKVSRSEQSVGGQAVSKAKKMSTSVGPQDADCQHTEIDLVSPWETIRKYTCLACDAVLTCACDGPLATRVLPHQALHGVDDYSGARVEVTHPLTLGICDDCRGLPPQAHPRAAIRGATSKLRRYYWREIWVDTHLHFLQWCDDQGIAAEDETGQSLVLHLEHEHKAQFDQIERKVIEEVSQLHKSQPKYTYNELSDADIIRDNRVRVIEFKAAYLTPTSQQALVVPIGCTDHSQAVPVEEFVAADLRRDGREVMFCESLPFQALFGCLMWIWVQGNDPLARWVGFGGRGGDGGGGSELIQTLLPPDFGRQAHGDRRRAELDEHLNLMGESTASLLWMFDYWLEPSRPLRQYLWAYKPGDEQRARAIIRVLGAAKVKTVLRWMAESYWERYLGWPDLFTWREAPASLIDVLFVEVKSSGDQLSGEQRNWIVGNRQRLGFDFALAKVHRSEKLHVTP